MNQDNLFVGIEAKAAEMVVGGATFFSTSAAAATSTFVLPKAWLAYGPGGTPAMAGVDLGSAKLEEIYGGLTIGIAP